MSAARPAPKTREELESRQSELKEEIQNANRSKRPMGSRSGGIIPGFMFDTMISTNEKELKAIDEQLKQLDQPAERRSPSPK